MNSEFKEEGGPKYKIVDWLEVVKHKLELIDTVAEEYKKNENFARAILESSALDEFFAKFTEGGFSQTILPIFEEIYRFDSEARKRIVKKLEGKNISESKLNSYLSNVNLENLTDDDRKEIEEQIFIEVKLYAESRPFENPISGMNQHYAGAWLPLPNSNKQQIIKYFAKGEPKTFSERMDKVYPDNLTDRNHTNIERNDRLVFLMRRMLESPEKYSEEQFKAVINVARNNIVADGESWFAEVGMDASEIIVESLTNS